ncbi:signal peptidase I (plasmid) [Arthrobacter sp. YA7-1]|uniref:signal peptidase I n=1 Tax=Arthrobacter sp. YA7-1 TaxID=2987701 RepID=UPI002226064D|nr:signal peptidase I [Arthrobacter sp. YA7-1]UYY83735.1 signal peptidase I [Arthrobacter sp. YA7-1]
MDSSLSSGIGSRLGARTRQRSSARRMLRLIMTTVSTLATLAFLAVGIVAPLLHIGFSPVLTGSMRPAYAPGDLLITAPADVSSLRPGQIAVFTPPGESTPFAHRITAISGTPSKPVLTTKGDANPAPDNWKAVLDQSQVPVVVAVVPSVGSVLLWIENPLQRALLTALFGLTVTGSAVWWILRSTPASSTRRKSGTSGRRSAIPAH